MTDKYLNKTGLGRVWARAREFFVDKQYFNSLASELLGVSVRGLYFGQGYANVRLLKDGSIVASVGRMWIDGVRVEPTPDYVFCDGEPHEVLIKFEGDTVPPNAFSESEICEAYVGGFVTELETESFGKVGPLKKVVLSPDVNVIGDSAFLDSPIVDFFCYASMPPSVGRNAFRGIDGSAVLYVPSDYAKRAYEGEGWGNYFYNIELIS